MLKRIVYLLFNIVWFPVVGFMAFFSAIVMPIIVVFIWIFKGDKDDELIDFMLEPFIKTAMFPDYLFYKD